MTAHNTYTGRAEHLWILALALIALAGSWILEPSDEGRLLLSVPVLGDRIALPQVCASRTLLGLPCPGCGMTRSFAALIRGDFHKALVYNPMGPVLFLACLFQVPYRIVEYTGVWDRSPLWNRFRRLFAVLAWIIISGLVAVGLLRLVCFFSAGAGGFQCTI